MEQRRIDMQAWRARLPIVGRRRQPIRVDINCQRNRVMSPLTLVLALAQNSLSRRHSTRETAKLRLFLHLAGRSISGQYMHFSKSNPKLGERERGQLLHFRQLGLLCRQNQKELAVAPEPDIHGAGHPRSAEHNRAHCSCLPGNA
jgi:hypothetical protein